MASKLVDLPESLQLKILGLVAAPSEPTGSGATTSVPVPPSSATAAVPLVAFLGSGYWVGPVALAMASCLALSEVAPTLRRRR